MSERDLIAAGGFVAIDTFVKGAGDGSLFDDASVASALREGVDGVTELARLFQKIGKVIARTGIAGTVGNDQIAERDINQVIVEGFLVFQI